MKNSIRKNKKQSFEEWLEETRQSPEYFAEHLALDFIMDCERQRNKQQLSYAELGRRMGVSRAYVSKLMSGMQNSTIGSLVKLAVALGCEVDVSLRVPPSARAATAPLLKFPSTKQKASAPRKDMAPKRARVRKPAKGVPAAARKPKG